MNKQTKKRFNKNYWVWVNNLNFKSTVDETPIYLGVEKGKILVDFEKNAAVHTATSQYCIRKYRKVTHFITLPKSIVEASGIKPGQLFSIERNDVKGITLAPLSEVRDRKGSVASVSAAI